MKKIGVIFLSFIMLVMLCSCDKIKDNTQSVIKGKVGISMPEDTIERWKNDAEHLTTSLKKNNFDVDVSFSKNDVETQIAQINKFIDNKVDAIIVAALDGTKLSDVLEKAKSDNIEIIAYDRLIMNTDAVDYYVSFDNEQVGKLQAEYVVNNLGIKENSKEKVNVEVLAGPTKDNNSKYLFSGAMNVLKQYKSITYPSKNNTFEKCTLTDWNSNLASERMTSILNTLKKSNKTTSIDAVVCASDILADGVFEAYKSAKIKTLPVIVSQDCEIETIKRIISGEQAMSVFKDTRVLAEKTAEMVKDILSGNKPEVNNTKTYNNGKKAVSSYLCEVQAVDKSNYKEVLIDSGYYSESELV